MYLITSTGTKKQRTKNKIKKSSIRYACNLHSGNNQWAQDEKKKEKKSQHRTGKQRITPTVFPRVSLFERFFLFSLRFQIFLDLYPFFVDFTLLHLKKSIFEEKFQVKNISICL